MKKPILIIIIMHKDLQNYKKNDLYADYFSWLKTELEFISGRDVKFTMHPHHEAPKYSKYHYKTEEEDGIAVMQGWKNLIQDWYSNILKHDEYEAGLTKILLLTRDNLHTKAGGLGAIGGYAYTKGHYAIAAITSYRAPAHEIGHMLGATHEGGEVLYNGWWHDTIMQADDFSNLRGNAYRFSDKNRENIRNYLSSFA